MLEFDVSRSLNHIIRILHFVILPMCETSFLNMDSELLWRQGMGIIYSDYIVLTH